MHEKRSDDMLEQARMERIIGAGESNAPALGGYFANNDLDWPKLNAVDPETPIDEFRTFVAGFHSIQGMGRAPVQGETQSAAPSQESGTASGGH